MPYLMYRYFSGILYSSNAQIIVIGDFWDTGTKDEMMLVACVNTGVSFIRVEV